MALNQFKLLLFLLFAIIGFLVSSALSADTECNLKIQLLLDNENENVYRLKIDEPLNDNEQKNREKSCWFTFETFADHGLKVEFEKFVIQEPQCYENSTDGCCDYLEIGTGSQVGSNSYQRYCGWVKIEPFVFNSNKIWLKYSIENFVDAFEGLIMKVKPFKLVFNKEKSGIISTELDYFNNMNLTYKIIMENDSLISFNFLNEFSMEKYTNKCIDYVEIGELDQITLEPIGNATKFCGQILPSQFSLNTNTAYVKVITNEDLLENGFKLEFTSIKYLFTESTGVIESQSKLMNITYKLKAPKDKKIELTINKFDFYPCVNQDMEEAIRQISSNNNDVCLFNHHLIISNQRGNIDQDFYDSFKNFKNSTDIDSQWKFCDCSKPVKKFISLSNELTIQNVLGELSSKYMNKKDALSILASYNISYRFINYEFIESNQIRIVQDANKLSPINGYLLRVKVPPTSHLRFYGKSIKCMMPSYSVLKITSESVDLRKINVLKLQQNEFKANNCSYLFDLSEPRTKIGQIKSVENPNWWHIEWYFKFNNPSERYDFEVNWVFLKNLLVEEKKNSFIHLPAQYGFNISEELFFNFESFVSERSHLFKLESSPVKANSSSTELSHIKVTSLKKSKNIPEEYILPQPKIEKESPIRISDFKLDSVFSSLNIKRNNEWSYNINYKLESNDGDCDFDISFCNYTTELVNPFSKWHNFDSNAIIQHLPKYSSINSYYEQDIIDKEYKDFYLSVSKLNIDSDKEVKIYSPLIKVQPNTPEAVVNSRVLMLSLDYMMLNNSNAEIDLLMVPSRSDIRNLIKQYQNVTFKSLGKFFNNGKERLSKMNNPRMFSNLNECPQQSFGSFVKGLSGTEISYDPIWHQVDRLNFFSCFDFHLAFDMKFENEVGLDNIQLDYGKELTECNSKDECNQHGTCFQYNSEKVCCCDPGYIGDKCEQQISPCKLFSDNDVSICKNNGTCLDININLGFKCDCPEGYSGEHCENEINECDSNPCQNNGQCFDQIGSYKCVCQIGYNGTNCEIESPGCKEKCSNEGTLKCYENKKDKNILCKCLTGYSGDDCSKTIEINECKSNPCIGEDSKCIDLKNDFKCVCSELRTGKYCEQKLDYCSDFGHQCLNNSKCLYANKDGSVINCSCAFGLVGKFCNETIPINNCKPNPCNDGTCIPLELGYKCDCPKGIIGRNCNVKPDYPCHKNKCVHGYCISLSANDYTCSCYGTYTGEFCDKELCNTDSYMNDYCVKENTIDVVKDPMFEDKNKCLCLCKNGYRGAKCEIEENVCEILNFKETGNYGSHCQNGGICSYDSKSKKLECSCVNGYKGDRCQLFNNHCQSNPCKYGKCSSKEDKYECECTNGWSGVNCDQEKMMCDINDSCEANNTLSVKYSYSNDECVCICKVGFEGKRCDVNFNDCKDNKCKNGAQCIDHIGSYECKCRPGYMGVFCEKKIEKCAAHPCRNGTCEETSVGFVCNCDKGFTGQYCETLINKCDPDPCKNGATCHNLIDDYYCACLPEFGSSRNCTERSIDPCITSPCLNNATCTAISFFSKEKNAPIYKGFTCRCPANYRGELCEQPIDICSSNPCKNHGRCNIPKENPNDYKCICFPAFTGKSCEIGFDECVSKPCNNGGKCLRSPEGFKCVCPFNFNGTTCEIPLEPCELMNCLNGGKCLVGLKNIPYCDCPNKRFTGTQCEIDVTQKANSTEVFKLKALSLELENQISCDILGNDVSLIDYVFTIMILFFLLIIIIMMVYIYVQFNIRRTKRYIKEAIYDNDSTEGTNHYK